MKIYKQIFTFLSIGILIVPQITLAAWWNPISWSVWSVFIPPRAQKSLTTPVMQPTTTVNTATTTSEKAIEKNDQKNSLNSLPKKKVSELTQEKVPAVTVPPTTKQTTFITPSGAILDASGKVLNQAGVDAKNAIQAVQDKIQQDAIRKQQATDAAVALRVKQDAVDVAIANAKMVATNALNKEYGLKINALRAQLIEANTLEDSSGAKAKEILRLYGNTNGVGYPDFVDTDFKRQVVSVIYTKLNAVNPVARDTGYVVGSLREQTSALNTQIAQLQNELERKLLEL